MVEQRGIEPLTSALRTRRSAKLSYCPIRRCILGSVFDGVKTLSSRLLNLLPIYLVRLLLEQSLQRAKAGGGAEPVVCGHNLNSVTRDNLDSRSLCVGSSKTPVANSKKPCLFICSTMSVKSFGL